MTESSAAPGGENGSAEATRGGTPPDLTAAHTASREAWERAYDDAMAWRDWQTCDILIEEREQADWYTPDVVEEDE